MSRIGKLPIPIPSGVKVTIQPDRVFVEGVAGKLEQTYESQYVSVAIEDGQVRVSRKGEAKAHRARHGLYRSLIHNMIQGVQKPYEKRLQLIGLGYRARLQGQELVLEIGYSHPIHYTLPATVKAEAKEIRSGGIEAEIMLRSPDKQLVGEVAAEIRALREPEPYKGTGIRYHDEHITRKEGKLAGAAAAKEGGA
ncbi:MAG: 50S ribosomal protein L6 [Candidatus Fraserbacteria bacterium RBG_16_55_9]|uniref:Large ribosomal subunit protein uL6 n=1 Tax=Fraserbacteria sp. (strain RBG_16_55_9) TaxID=1817864 RepID=A0A1F5UPD5_FRAXR|nr:ribosomal protein L6 [uncultured bacterium]OGF53006.1 MAG: 50S ribosomal protein L6 [Candidatus Fraserbacteria bacterium RBG_16_55_9]